MIGVINLGTRMNGNQWWSKKFQLLVSVILAVLVILVFFKVVKPWLIQAVMAVSLAVGILQSFVVGFC
jgi:hypothetical protein